MMLLEQTLVAEQHEVATALSNIGLHVCIQG